MNPIVIAEALNKTVKIRAVKTTELVETARLKHDLYPTSAAALGRVMTVGSIMASEWKDPEAKTIIEINGGGPCGSIIVHAKGNGELKGLIGDPHIYLFNEQTGKLDVGKAVGTNGYLKVMKDLGLKEPFSGIVNLQSGEIGDDFSYYFAISEQTPSVVSVGVLVNTDYSIKAAGGLIIQLLPDAPEETIEYVENLVKTMKPMSTYIDEGLTPEEIIKTLFEDANILEYKEVYWHCDCSKEHFKDALALIDRKDLVSLIEEDHKAEITCQYCNKTYHFEEAELKEILEKKDAVENREHLNS